MIDQNAIAQRYRALPPQAKQLLVQSLTPDVVRVLAHVLGPEFAGVAQMFLREQQQQQPQQALAPQRPAGGLAQPPANRSAFGGALR